MCSTGFGVVVTSRDGSILAYGSGAPPSWVCTAAAAEAWALQFVLALSPVPPWILTDCQSLVTTACGGTPRALAASQPLARIWASICGALDGKPKDLVTCGKLRWIPAHLSADHIGTELRGGKRFTTVDWRANRLADALAKEAAARESATDADVKLLKSAEAAAEHACALLGVVTRAANHHPVLVTLAYGKTVLSHKRDSADPPRKKPHAEKTAKPVKFEPQDITVPIIEQAPLALPRYSAPKHAAQRAKEEAAKEAERRKREAASDSLKRAIDSSSGSSKPCQSTPSAASITAALRERVRAKQAKTEGLLDAA